MATQDVYNPALLRQLLDYDPDTGVLTWRERPPEMFNGHSRTGAAAWNKRYAGKAAFPTNHTRGYGTSTILYERVMAHRVAWCMFHNAAIPAGMYVDHINGQRADNRIENLRLASPAENQGNRESIKNAARGAFYHKTTGKWQAAIRLHLGTFQTQQEAADAYEAAAEKLRGEFYLANGKRATVSRAL